MPIGIHDCLPIGPGSRSRIPWNQTALAEIDTAHERGSELIAAATEAHMAIRWPVRLALVWDGGHSTWPSWQKVLTLWDS